MTRRLLAAILGAVIATVLVVGAGTIVLSWLDAPRAVEGNLRDHIDEMAGGLREVGRPPADGTETRAQALRRLELVRAVLALEGVQVVQLRPDGVVTGEVPAGVRLSRDQVQALLDGEVLSGSNHRLAWAARAVPEALVDDNAGAPALLGTREVTSGLERAQTWFVIATGLAVVVATSIGLALGRKITRPVRQAAGVAHLVADGQLDARLDEPAPAEHDELAELARSINAMAFSLERARDMEEQFLLSVSHDLRTPLTSIRGYAEAIADGAVADVNRSAEVILAEARRLERLVRDLLELAKLQSRQFTVELRDLDLATVAADAVEGFAATLAPLRIEHHDHGPVPVAADRDRLRQVLANLIENASKFTRTEVVVRTSIEQGWAQVVVDDDGPGIPPQDLPHVFERMYQTQLKPRRHEAGSGLGLAIVRELVDAMGGRVAAGVAPSGGARMMVWLPVRTANAFAPPASPASAVRTR